MAKCPSCLTFTTVDTASVYYCRCGSCDLKFCLKCHRSRHFPASCAEMSLSNKEGDEIAFEKHRNFVTRMTNLRLSYQKVVVTNDRFGKHPNLSKAMQEKHHSRLPTLLPGNSIVVTNNSVSSYTLDGVLVSEPDLFVTSSIAIHGVASSLDFSRYGDFDNGDTTLADSLRPRRRRRRRGDHGGSGSRGDHGGSGSPGDDGGSGSPGGDFDFGDGHTNGDTNDTNKTSASLFTAHYSTGSFLIPLAALALF